MYAAYGATVTRMILVLIVDILLELDGLYALPGLVELVGLVCVLAV